MSRRVIVEIAAECPFCNRHAGLDRPIARLSWTCHVFADHDEGLKVLQSKDYSDFTVVGS